MDFFILLSSLASVLGGLGMAAYAAANLFMDAFAALRNGSGGTPWISVNLDGWVTDSQAVEPIPAGFGAGLTGLAMTNIEALSIFRLLTKGFHRGQVAVSTGSLSARVAQWCTGGRQPGGSAQGRQDVRAQARPHLRSRYVEPSTRLEKEIAGIWRELFGIEEVGATDNFWELGGDSLLGTQLLSKLRRNFQIAPTLETLFQEPTVGGLATYIETSQRASQWRPDPAEIGVEEGVL